MFKKKEMPKGIEHDEWDEHKHKATYGEWSAIRNMHTGEVEILLNDRHWLRRDEEEAFALGQVLLGVFWEERNDS